MQPRVDFYLTFLGEITSYLKFKNRMLKYWGTEYVTDDDGNQVEVFKSKYYLYPCSDTDLRKKITNLFGITKDVEEQDYSKLSTFYLTLDPKHISDTSFTKDIVATRINNYITLGDSKELFLSFNSDTDYELLRGATKEEIFTYVQNNYTTIIDTMNIVTTEQELVYVAIAPFLLLDNENNFTIEMLDAKVSSNAVYTNSNTSVYNSTKLVRYQNLISINMKVTRIKNIDENGTFIARVLAEQDEAKRRNLANLAQSIENISFSDTFISTKPRVTNSIWCKNQLRVSLTNTANMKSKDFSELFGSHLTTGYTLPKKKWWEKMLAPLLFVAAIIFAPWTGGGSLALYWSAVAIAFTVLSVALASMGYYAAAKYAGRYATVASVISFYYSISSSLQVISKQVAQQGLLKTAWQSLKSKVLDLFTTEIQTVAIDSATQVATTTTTRVFSLFNTVSTGAKIAFKLQEQRVKNQAKELGELSEKNRKLYEEQLEVLDKEHNIALEDIIMYTKPIDTNNIKFEVDYLYGPTKYNIQRASFNTGRGINNIKA